MSDSARNLTVCGVVAILCLIVVPQTARAGENGMNGFIDSFGYGYTVTVTINGTAIKAIHGDGQQATRLFSVDHPMKAEAPPEQADLFILREGENTICVEFQRQGDAQNALDVKFEIPDRYDVPLFRLRSETRQSGSVERTFVIDKTAPPEFTTIEVNDDSM